MTGGRLATNMEWKAETARWAGLKRFAADALLWCLLGVLMAAGFANADAVAGMYPPLSLRFDKPVSGQAAYEARLYSIEQGDENTFWPTFWREGTAVFSSEYVTATANCIAYSGDAALVWPAEYLYGAAPGVTDGSGCAVSSALAWKLWGNTNVVGRIVEVDGTDRVVRAVFEGETELALLPFSDSDTAQSWSAAELSGGPADAVREDAEAYAAASSLGKPNSILTGGSPSFLASAMAALPVALMAGYGLALAMGMIRKHAAARKLIPFLLLIGIAILLPRMLEAVPAWLIPTRWSDFSFWSSLIKQAEESLREFLGAASRFRDIEGQIGLLMQTGIALASTCCALTVCFRWQTRRRERLK